MKITRAILIPLILAGAGSVPLLSADAAAPDIWMPKGDEPALAKVGQLIVARPTGVGATGATLTLLERDGRTWRIKEDGIAATFGRKGLAAAGAKVEGDGRTPTGLFALGTAFGYAAKIRTGLDYRQTGEDDIWIDDPESPQYNQWASLAGTAPRPRSFERLRRQDGLYEYGVVVRYNTEPVVAGKGSAIFMHVWRRPGAVTAGCVAMAKDNLKSLLAWLDKGRNPHLAIGDAASLSRAVAGGRTP